MSQQELDKSAKEANHLEFGTSIENSSLDGTTQVSSKALRRVMLKQDLVILPLLSLSIFFGYLDRGNIGNARVLGMQKELHLTSQQFYNIIMMFFVGYMVIELPAGMAMRYAQPRYVFAAAMVVFGVCACCLSVADGYAGAIILRLVIGFGEAFVNNAWLYISIWYSPSELALRSAGIYLMTPIAGAISGVLAYGVGRHLEHASGLFAWQWLFIIEGVATVAFALVVFFLLPGMPDRVAEHGCWLFRSHEERQIILSRYHDGRHTKGAKFQWYQVRLSFKDPKTWLGAVVTGVQGVGIGAFSIFLPTLINEFGFTALQTQLYSMIPYAFGLFAMIFVAFFISDRLLSKSYTVIICLLTTATGFVILLSTANKVALMAGACFVLAGAYPGLVVSTSFWLPLHGGYTKRATAVWITQVWVQTASIIASQVYRHPPRFFLGHGFSLAAYVVAICCTYLLRVICMRANATKERGKLDYAANGDMDPDAAKSFEELCDYHPRYIYTL